MQKYEKQQQKKLFIDQCPEEGNWHYSSGDVYASAVGKAKKCTDSEDACLPSTVQHYSAATASEHNASEQGANVLFWQNTSEMLSAAEERKRCLERTELSRPSVSCCSLLHPP